MKILILFALILSSCAMPSRYHFNAGTRLYNENKFQESEEHFLVCAKNENSTCMASLGYLNEIQDYKKTAIEWYTMSASYGNTYSIEQLKRLGQPVPNITRTASDFSDDFSIGHALGDVLKLTGAALNGYNQGGNGNSDVNAYSTRGMLKNQWIKDGVQFCQYDNGTVINNGANICPLDY